jgi:hypothetical protein
MGEFDWPPLREDVLVPCMPGPAQPDSAFNVEKYAFSARRRF